MANTMRNTAPHPRPRMVVEGNTVRREEYIERKKKQEKEKIARSTIRRNREKALQISIPYLLMLAAATVAVVAICVSYLKVQSSITSHQTTIGKLESQLSTLKTNNSATESRINAYVDLDYIYKVATEELGMTYASDNQVIYYDKSESEYVRQYEDIPTN